jgi:HTH-type transcriptional regulator, sugar sensing transcriptional regulator
MKSELQHDASATGRIPENLVNDLRKLGFTEYEARTYLTLLEDFPATAYEIGKNGGLVRANVYNAVDALEKMGAVQPVSENPVRYVPIDPTIVLDVIARRTSTLCMDVAERLAAMVPEKKQDYVWNLSGADSVHRRIGEIITNARKHIWIKAHEALLEKHLDDLREAGKRGVQLLIIVFGPPGQEKRLQLGPGAEVYPHEGSGVVVGLGQSLVTITADFHVALTANVTDGAYGALTQNQSVVNLAESLIRHEVYLAEIFAQHGERITERFGPYLRDLRMKYLPKDQVEALRKTIIGVGRKKTARRTPRTSAPNSRVR